MRLLAVLTSASCCSSALALAIQAPYETASLAQHALQKVLHEASEIFGFSAGTNTSSRSTWMSTYPDATPLTSLSIPGIHDAATWNYTVARQEELQPITDLLNITSRDPTVYRCQRSSIASALDAGIRFFDMRYALDPTGTKLVFWHHEALMSEVSGLEEVLFSFWDWLDAHPSEVLFLSFQYEGGTHAGASNSAAVQAIFFEVLTSPASKQYFLQVHNSLGSLGEARGKAILVRRFDMDRSPPEYEDELPGIHLSPSLWTDNSPNITLVYNETVGAAAYIEDYYEPSIPANASASENIAAKLEAVVAHLDLAASDELADSLFITFTSGQHLDADAPVNPEIMALGNGTEVTPKGGVNQQLLSVLGEFRGKRKGIVVVDFWDEPDSLIDALLDL